MLPGRKHSLPAPPSPTQRETKRPDEAGVARSPWRMLRAASASAAVAFVRVGMKPFASSPSRVTPSDAVDGSTSQPLSQQQAAGGGAAAAGEPMEVEVHPPRKPPTKLKFDASATLPTEPAPSHDARLLAADASLPEVAAFLCAGAHSFESGACAPCRRVEEDVTLPRRALDWRGILEARLGSASLVRRNQAEAMAALGKYCRRRRPRLAWAGNGRWEIFYGG